MGPNNDGADDQPIADMLRMIEPARREVGDGEAAADGAARVPSAIIASDAGRLGRGDRCRPP